MKRAVLLLSVWIGFSAALDARAEDAVDVFTGVSLNAARSTQNGVTNRSGGIAGMLSARYPGKYYGFEIQGGYFGRAGQYSANAEIDVCALGLLPLGGSGITLYGKAGAADVLSSTLANNVSVTYGAGIEYQVKSAALRFGAQHFSLGGPLHTTVRTNIIGLTVLVK